MIEKRRALNQRDRKKEGDAETKLLEVKMLVMEKWRLGQEMTQIKDLAERYGHVLLSRKNNQCLYINGWMDECNSNRIDCRKTKNNRLRRADRQKNKRIKNSEKLTRRNGDRST